MSTRSAKKASASRINSAEAAKPSVATPLPQDLSEESEQNASEAPNRGLAEKTLEELEQEELKELINVFQKRVDLLPLPIELLKQGLSEIGPSPDHLKSQSNDVESIDIVKTLECLQELYASSNKIQNICCLDSHKNINILDLESNAIESVEMISVLSTLPLLRHLKITLNPIEQLLQSDPEGENDFPIHNNAYYPPSFRLKTIFLIPKLTVLNSIPVTPEEKVASVNIYNPPTIVKISKQHQHQTKQQALAYARIKAEDLMRVKRLRPIVLCGPSGSGKRTLAARLLRDHPHIYGLSISHTTRKPRPGEEHGVHYWFVSKKEMLQMNQEGKFIEMVTLFGNMYGTSMESIDRVTEQGKICILALEYEGMMAIQKSSLKPRYIMITTSSIHILEQRLAKRIGNENDHQQWVSKAKEAQNYEGVDHVIVNDDLEKAVAELESYCLDLYWKEFDQDD
ncbi:hypothetical protein HDV06_002933 [Boothiomyces sp. JEL0866]|nr:hypothetical protein HDV06_002933 [Boothiomyces sp. JEL0866]